MRHIGKLLLLFSGTVLAVGAQSGPPDSAKPPASQADAQPAESAAQYVLGPDDHLKIWSLGMEEISDKPVRIDPSGDLDLPEIGKVHAAGLTLAQLRAKLVERFSALVLKPQVSIEIVEYGSQPISVIGAVNHPGIFQLQGRKTLSEVLSLAGGLGPNAGPHINISRSIREGVIPLDAVKRDPAGNFTTAVVQVREVLGGAAPVQNILVRPHDVITVPAAEAVFVMGQVRKPGPVLLSDRDSISVLQAVSMAEGYGPTPAPQSSKIVRVVPGSKERQEIPVDLKKILQGKAEDVALRPNDILVVPPSGSKRAAARAVEAAIQTATGVVIWRRP